MGLNSQFILFLKENIATFSIVTVIVLIWIVAIIEGSNLHTSPKVADSVSKTYLLALWSLILVLVSEAVIIQFNFPYFTNHKEPFMANALLASVIIITTFARAYLATAKHGIRKTVVFWTIPAIYLIFLVETIFVLSQ